MAKSRRLKLHQELLDISGLPVYYQPPETVKMEYPCIVYELESGRNLQADNNSYLYTDMYSVKIIHRDPDSELPDILRRHFLYINRGQRYKAENLYHDSFTLYY